MLDLVRINAPQHMDNPEFQQDMLESIDDALKRMGKVQSGLSVLKGEMTPIFKHVDLSVVLGGCIKKISKMLPDLDIVLKCPPDIAFLSDPDIIGQIMENLLINSREAGGAGTSVQVSISMESMIQIVVEDNGPGIPAEYGGHGVYR